MTLRTQHVSCILCAIALSMFPASADTPVFARDVQPLFAKNCFACHGPDEAQRKAELRLDQREDALRARDGKPAVIVPGDHLASELFRRISSNDAQYRMPPASTGHTLKPDEIDRIAAWIDSGARFDQHWAFVPPQQAPAPPVQQAAWPRNDIDRFLLARMEHDGLAPSPEADKITLLRRVCLDLTGLPPDPDSVEAFLADTAPDAFEKVVDRLLASPHFGERMARHWLDLARYADSNGYSIDAPREIWKYRDWVINALNENKPFDQSVIEQLAGDMLPNATQDQLIATGFHRNTMINQEGGIDKEEFRIRAVIDRVNTTATVFLGLTMGCAECHSHKYDPISQKEYYQFFAFFNPDDEEDLPLPAPEEAEPLRLGQERIAALTGELDAYWAASKDRVDAAWLAALPEAAKNGLKPEERTALEQAPVSRTPAQDARALDVFKREDAEANRLSHAISDEKEKLPKVVTTMILRRQAQPRDTHLLVKGDFTRPAEQVAPGVPAVLHKLPNAPAPTRLDLAHWIVSKENPLTARVTVNRFWQYFFGKGIVETENDFGIQGSLPTDPELLDWLAVEFMRDWNTKRLLRLIVTSAAYRQASTARPEVTQRDPVNKRLARQNRIRLDAEIIRDSALAASGLLSPVVGGPSVNPPQPEGVMNLGQSNREWKTSEGAGRYRRGLYTFFWRATPYPSLTVFDAPDAMETCTRRNRSNTPLQSLTLLNDEAFVEFAQGLARRVLREAPADDALRISRLMALCLARTPAPDETAVLQALLDTERQAFASTQVDAELVAAVDFGNGVPRSELAAWTSVARAVLNLDEFITRE